MQRLVVEGPYRYTRNPLYVTAFSLIVGADPSALYLALQLPFEERELRERFGAFYRRYGEFVPRFFRRLRPVRRRDLES